MFNIGDTIVLKPNRYSSMGIPLISGHEYSVIGVYHNETNHYKIRINQYMGSIPVLVYSSAFNLLKSEYRNFEVNDVVTLKSMNIIHTEVLYGINYSITNVFSTKVLIKNLVCGNEIIIHMKHIKLVEKDYNNYQIY